MYRARFPDPLGLRIADNRFSSAQSPYATLFLGETLKVCFVETIMRDNGDGRLENFVLPESELHSWNRAIVRVHQSLTLVDLRHDHMLAMGIPSDVARASDQTLGRLWGHAIWAHDDAPDGMIFNSRLNGQENIAVFDRALPKLRVDSVAPILQSRDEMADIIDSLALDLV